jgi:hypothetical protein
MDCFGYYGTKREEPTLKARSTLHACLGRCGDVCRGGAVVGGALLNVLW